jgi:HlyB family type I secretion system ABC transporter
VAAEESRFALKNVPLLRLLPADVRKVVLDSFSAETISFGTPIVKEHEPSAGFYVLVSGKARVVKQGDNGAEIALNVLKPGDSFGEMSLLSDAPAKATVRAVSEVQVLKLDKSVFHAVLQNNPQIKKYLELQSQHRSLQNFFHLYAPFKGLPPDAYEMLLKEIEKVEVAPNTMVIRQGDRPGPLFIVETGRLRVFNENNGERQYRAYLRKGDFFGEMSVFKGIPRTASVESVSACELLKLTEKTFQKLLVKYPDFKAGIEERIEQYDYKKIARVPTDFEEELLPADVQVHEKVKSSQVDVVHDTEVTEAAPFATKEGHFKKKGKIRRFPMTYQIDEMDDGAACLAMVCRYFGKNVSLARIRQLVHTSLDGTSLKALCIAGTELGLATHSIKTTPKNLDKMPLPAIVYWHGNHWVVLFHLNEKTAWVADPALGHRQIQREEFEERWTGYAALFDYTKEFEKTPEDKADIKWLAPFFKPFSGFLTKALALAVIVSALEMVLPVFTQVIVDRVLVQADIALLHILILCMIVVLIFMGLSLVVQRYLLSFSVVRVDAAALDFITRKLLALPMSYFNTRRTGDIQRRMLGMRYLREFLVENGVLGCISAVQLTAALALMLVYSPVLTLVFLSVVPLYAVMMFVSKRRLRGTFDNLEEAFARYDSFQIDAIRGIETVKALGAEGSFREKMIAQFQAVARHQFKADFTAMVYQASVQTINFLSISLFLWIGAHQVMKGQLTIGGLVAFNSLVALANAPIWALLSLWDKFQLSLIQVNRLNDVLIQEPEQGVDHSHLLPVKGLQGHIRFENVGFRYGGPDSPRILEGVTFEVPAGKMIAIVGRSGSGKTTLIKCLAGLLEPTEGTIYYDGVDMKTMSYRDLRRHIGFVLQENHLFDDSIAKNISFGDYETDMDRVLWASRLANAHDFIERLPLGYETPVGESGIALSGGQRQRLAIARALYHQPPVLIFDEATSALDTESERAVKENMDELLAKRTSFVIAHRLSTIHNADMIMVLEKGKLAEHGSHQQLMEQQGLYFYLVSQQLEM